MKIIFTCVNKQSFDVFCMFCLQNCILNLSFKKTGLNVFKLIYLIDMFRYGSSSMLCNEGNLWLIIPHT